MKLFGIGYPFQEQAGELGGEGGDGGDDPSPEPKTIPLEVLPEELRGMSENEIKFFLSKTLSGVRDTNERNRELNARLEALETSIRTPAVQDEPDPDADKPLSELIIENPEKAIERVAIAKGWITGMRTIGDQAGEALFDSISRKIDGFEDHEDDVRKLIKESNAPVNKETIARAFEMVVGRKAIEERGRARRKEQGGDPAPKPTSEKTTPTLPEETSFEREIREAAGKTREQWAALKAEDHEIKVPLSPR